MPEPIAIAAAVGKWSMNKLFEALRSKACKELKDGDVTDTKVRDIIMKEIDQIKESLGALRNAHFAVCKLHMKMGIELLEHGKLEAAEDELKLAKEKADIAFGVVPNTTDRIAAAKIALVSALILNKENIGSCKTYICSYVEDVNKIPEVQKSVKAAFGDDIGDKLKRLSYKKERNELLWAVSSFNNDCTKCASQIQCDILESRKICYGTDKWQDGSCLEIESIDV